MTGAIFSEQDVDAIGMSMIDELKRLAADAPLKRYRYCLHKGTSDPVQEMIIAMRRDSIVPPHRHREKSESFHLIEGRLEVRFLNDRGEIARVMKLGDRDSGDPFICRIEAGIWHEVVVLTDFAVIHETTQGPFQGSELSETPPWISGATASES